MSRSGRVTLTRFDPSEKLFDPWKALKQKAAGLMMLRTSTFVEPKNMFCVNSK